MEPAQWELVDAVDTICRVYGASVTSWWRSTERNAAKGGVANSQHTKGLAMDVVYPGGFPPPDEVRGFLGPSMQLVRETSKGHDHIEQDPRLLLARGEDLASAISPNFPSGPPAPGTRSFAISPGTPTSLASRTRSSTPSARSASAPARTAGARSPLDKLARKRRPRG